MMHHQFACNRIVWVKFTLALGFFAGLSLSYKTFITPRPFFPYIPFFGFLQPMPLSLEYVLFGALFVLLVPMTISSYPSKHIFCFIGLASVLLLWDQSRLHAWLYQYACMLAALGIYFWGDKGEREKEKSFEQLVSVNNLYFFLRR